MSVLVSGWSLLELLLPYNFMGDMTLINHMNSSGKLFSFASVSGAFDYAPSVIIAKTALIAPLR